MMYIVMIMRFTNICNYDAGVFEEAKFFGIEELFPQLENLCATANRPRDDLALTRRDVIEVLMGTSPNFSEMRFQGVNLVSGRTTQPINPLHCAVCIP